VRREGAWGCARGRQARAAGGSLGLRPGASATSHASIVLHRWLNVVRHSSGWRVGGGRGEKRERRCGPGCCWLLTAAGARAAGAGEREECAVRAASVRRCSGRGCRAECTCVVSIKIERVIIFAIPQPLCEQADAGVAPACARGGRGAPDLWGELVSVTSPLCSLPSSNFYPCFLTPRNYPTPLLPLPLSSTSRGQCQLNAY
jgi:hypothetical protein